MSLGLQHGVPLETFVRKFAFTTYEPKGFTDDPQVRQASSLLDYIFRKLGVRYVPGYAEEMGVAREEGPGVAQDASAPPKGQGSDYRPEDALEDLGRSLAAQGGRVHRPTAHRAAAGTGPPCPTCGHVTRRAGACYACANCGGTSGCG